MNIFVLDQNPVTAAQLQCNRHVVKMILESGQMLSTAHRYLDGEVVVRDSKSGKRKVRQYAHPTLDSVLYKSVHLNHPCTVWTRENTANYMWHYEHFIALCDEYTYRYGKVHKTDSLLRSVLSNPPKNISYSNSMTPFALAMFDECKVSSDPVECYRRYYQSKQDRFKMEWSPRSAPEWFSFHEKEHVA